MYAMSEDVESRHEVKRTTKGTLIKPLSLVADAWSEGNSETEKEKGGQESSER